MLVRLRVTRFAACLACRQKHLSPKLLLEEDRAATVNPDRQASGWRNITLQIADIDAVHDDLCSRGVREGLAPTTLGGVARISMILDPDGNWIELSRRASIVGSLR